MYYLEYRVLDANTLTQNIKNKYQQILYCIMSNSINAMNTILGQSYHIFTSGSTDPIVLTKLPDEDLVPKNSVTESNPEKNPSSQQVENEPIKQSEKTTDDYLFQFYLGSMTVVGLFILFRMIQKSK